MMSRMTLISQIPEDADITLYQDSGWTASKKYAGCNVYRGRV